MRITPRRVLVLVVIALLVLGGMFAYQNFGPDPPIRVSRETTWLTAPLADDGLPDYSGWLDSRRRDGVSPESNAAIPLIQATWPLGYPLPDQQRFIGEQLRMPIPDRNGIVDADADLRTQDSPYRSIVLLLLSRHGIKPGKEINNFQQFDVWSEEWHMAEFGTYERLDEIDLGGTSSDEERKLLSEQEYRIEQWQSDPFGSADTETMSLIGMAQFHPWRSDQLPPLATWVEEHQREFELLHQAATRSEFYVPLELPSQKKPVPITNLRDASAELIRTALSVLTIRAMHFAGRGEWEAACDDLHAAYRIAEHVPADTAIGVVMRINRLRSVDEAVIRVLAEPNLSEASILQMLSYQRNRQPMSFALAASDEMSRIQAIEGILEMAGVRYGKNEAHASFIDAMIRRAAEFDDQRTIDWNIVLECVNNWFDRATQAFGVADASQRTAAINNLYADIDAACNQKPSAINYALSRKTRSEFIGNSFGAALCTVALPLPNEEDHNARLPLMQTAAALALHRARHGDYPDSLDELVPAILPALPVDNYHGKPLAYTRTGNGYLLVNVGPNGVDDGGSDEPHEILRGYEVPSTEAQENVLREILGLQPYDPESLDTLQSLIPSGADDLAIRMPPLPADWSLLDPPKRRVSANLADDAEER